MEKILALVSTVKVRRDRRDDDRIDRLNSHYTVMICLTFTVVVSANIYIGTPITCWVPAEFHHSHIKYANSYCWVRDTYYLPWEDRVPRPAESQHSRVIPYYQWVPFILLIQALAFYFPSIVWHGFNDKAGVDADNILETAQTFQALNKSEIKDKTLKFIARQIMRFLKGRRVNVTSCSLDIKQLLSATVCVVCGRYQGNYLITLYLFVKILFLANSAAQIFFLNFVLGSEYHMYGIHFVRGMLFPEDWTLVSAYFPRVTMCDFQVRRLGNVHRYSVQCVLPINMFTEKIYLFLWFWMAIVALLTVFSFLMWFVRVVFPSQRRSYLSQLLELAGRIKNRASSQMVEEFTMGVCKQDGVFLIRLIEHNTSKITATEIVGALWDEWKDSENKNKRRERHAQEEALLP